MEKNNHVILFDGECNLCNNAVRFIIRRDTRNKFKFAALQSDVGKRLLESSPINLQNVNSIVYIDHGNYFTKSDAFFKILNTLGGLWNALMVFKLLPKNFRDFIYDQIARRRYRIFGKRDSCMVPTADIRQKFLE